MQVKIKVSFAWWLPLYIKGVALTAALTGSQPDMSKVGSMIVKAMRTKVEIVKVGQPPGPPSAEQIEAEREALCIRAYGEHWPAIKANLSRIDEIVATLKRGVK